MGRSSKGGGSIGGFIVSLTQMILGSPITFDLPLTAAAPDDMEHDLWICGFGTYIQASEKLVHSCKGTVRVHRAKRGREQREWYDIYRKAGMAERTQ
eukprot:scaffold10527_cov152-Skeletonema_dohrnii-CCMP3373.AAC.3